MTAYLVGLNNFEALSRGLPKFEVFQMPGFNLSSSIFHILLPASRFSGLKEDSSVFHPSEKLTNERLPLAAVRLHQLLAKEVPPHSLLTALAGPG